jgi:methyl-accepting chemotaxis protein
MMLFIRQKTLAETRWFIMKMNNKKVAGSLFGIVFLQVTVIVIVYILKNVVLLKLLPFMLVLITLSIVIYTYKQISSTYRQKEEDVNKLVRFLENPMAVAYTDQITEEFRPIFQAIKEFKFRHNRIITDFTETTATIAENNNTILKMLNNLANFLDEFDNTLSSLNDSLLLVAHIDMSYGEKEVSSFLKVNVELEHFRDNLNEYSSLLKKVFSLYINDTTDILRVEKRVLKEVLSLQKDIKEKIVLNKKQTGNFEESITKLNKDIGEFAEKLSTVVRIKSTLQEHNKIFFTISEQISFLEQSVEKKVHEVDTSITSLDEISEKMRLLALNASIYAADAGEYGKGFGIIASEMKKLADSAMRYHGKIRQTTEGVALGIEQLKKSNSAFLERKNDIIGEIENLSYLAESVVSFLKEVQMKVSDTEMSLRKVSKSLDKVEERVEASLNKITPRLSSCREKLYAIEHSDDLKLRIDKALVSIVDFNKKMSREIPEVFATLNSIFEKTSVTHSNFVLIKDNVNQFLSTPTVKKLRQFRYELNSDNVRLFKDSVKILGKSHKALKKIIE